MSSIFFSLRSTGTPFYMSAALSSGTLSFFMSASDCKLAQMVAPSSLAEACTLLRVSARATFFCAAADSLALLAKVFCLCTLTHSP